MRDSFSRFFARPPVNVCHRNCSKSILDESDRIDAGAV